ncbi:hypothetical protein [Rhodococcus wratislaviensis]|nr:hypothetical protein [Rhodococcus wratislaviensis]
MQATRDVWDGVGFDVNPMRWPDLVPLNKAVVEAVIERGGVPANTDLMDLQYAIQKWIFPLSSLDLTPVKVDVKDLQSERASYLAREYGL